MGTRCIRARIPLRKYAQADIANASLDASYVAPGDMWALGTRAYTPSLADEIYETLRMSTPLQFGPRLHDLSDTMAELPISVLSSVSVDWLDELATSHLS